ncbi:hypothetical protein TRFO_05041 [Tritrichomonas foetus]|uniref:Uncharacterized protein n=1 Tax=Tritrichomonas foetus TaxID=1144522 RepID=A0A1J4KE69_9EUKA|nr:hypothetical protein TRFO_05041 [Tritrichomonas foetus]|eukprot:OHT07926.1 hypothetical protein TRFO_05041 [Tritrichomonas foetus]
MARTKLNFATKLFNFIILVAGGSFTTIFAVAGILCSISALIAISIENRIFFQRLCRFVGIVICIFGFLLPFRHISLFATALCCWWALLLFQTIKQYQFYQGMAAIALSLIFWSNNARHENSLAQNVADFVLFVVLPSVFMLVCLSRTGNLLGDTGSHSKQPVIPLEAWFAKLGNLVKTIIPPTN